MIFLGSWPVGVCKLRNSRYQVFQFFFLFGGHWIIFQKKFPIVSVSYICNSLCLEIRFQYISFPVLWFWSSPFANMRIEPWNLCTVVKHCTTEVCLCLFYFGWFMLCHFVFLFKLCYCMLVTLAYYSWIWIRILLSFLGKPRSCIVLPPVSHLSSPYPSILSTWDYIDPHA